MVTFLTATKLFPPPSKKISLVVGAVDVAAVVVVDVAVDDVVDVSVDVVVDFAVDVVADVVLSWPPKLLISLSAKKEKISAFIFLLDTADAP